MSLPADTFKSYEETEIPDKDITNPFSKRRIIKNLVVASLGTLFVLSADDAILTMQSTLNRDQGVGVASVAVQYGFSFLTSLLLPKYMVLRYGCKTNLKISIIMFLPFLVANYCPVYYLMMLSSVSIGIGHSLLVGTLDPYLNNLSRLYADLRIEELQEEEMSAASKKSASIEMYTSLEPDFKTFATPDIFCNLDNGPANVHTVFNYIHVKTEEVHERRSSNYSTTVKYKLSGACYHLGKEIVKKGKQKENCIYAIDLNSKTREKALSKPKNRIVSKEAVLKDNIKDEKTSILESTTIRFFGMHSLINMSSYVFSNLASYFVLQNGYSYDSLSISSANESCSCGAAYCNVETVCSEYNLQKPSTVNRNMLISLCVGLCFLAGVVWIVFLDDLKREKNSISFSADTLLATFRHMKKKYQLLLIPMTMNTGMLMGFYIGDFTKSYIGCAWGIQFVGLVTTCSGGGMAIASILSGWLAKPLGRRPIFLSAAILNAVLIAILLKWQPNSLNPAMFFITAGLFGSLYGIYYTQIRAFYGVLFSEDQEAAFGAFQLWYCVGSCLSLSYSNFICNEIKIHIFILFCILGLIGYLIVESSYSLMKKNVFSKKSVGN